MLAGLTPLELGRLRMSVGYGRHRTRRPLSPIEVGKLIRAARLEGASLEECASAMQLAGVGHIGRFLQILQLPEDLLHLVDWGAGKDFIGFSSAVELVRLRDPEDQRAVASSILSDRLTSKEVRQIAQLRKRSGRTIHDCVKEILGMRPTIIRRYIFIGSNSLDSTDILQSLSQNTRNDILASGIAYLGLVKAAGRLGPKLFTLVGGEDFNDSLKRVGRDNVEPLLRAYIAEALANV